jgi:hypothetical protein
MLCGHSPEGDLKVFRCGSQINEILLAWLPLFPQAQDPVCLEATQGPAHTKYLSFHIDGDLSAEKEQGEVVGVVERFLKKRRAKPRMPAC